MAGRVNCEACIEEAKLERYIFVASITVFRRACRKEIERRNEMINTTSANIGLKLHYVSAEKKTIEESATVVYIPFYATIGFISNIREREKREKERERQRERERERQREGEIEGEGEREGERERERESYLSSIS